jgi:hypothetical protein
VSNFLVPAADLPLLHCPEDAAHAFGIEPYEPPAQFTLGKTGVLIPIAPNDGAERDGVHVCTDDTFTCWECGWFGSVEQVIESNRRAVEEVI